MNLEREEGYYWIKYQGEWTVGCYDRSFDWTLTGTDELIQEDSIEQVIEERLIPPQ